MRVLVLAILLLLLIVFAYLMDQLVMIRDFADKIMKSIGGSLMNLGDPVTVAELAISAVAATIVVLIIAMLARAIRYGGGE